MKSNETMTSVEANQLIEGFGEAMQEILAELPAKILGIVRELGGDDMTEEELQRIETMLQENQQKAKAAICEQLEKSQANLE